MCGINGYISTQQSPSQVEDILKEMNRALHHRGPDGEGYDVTHTDEYTVGLGQTRLAIIDLTDAGLQPMYYTKEQGAFGNKFHAYLLEEYASQALQIVFNGEIYNYQSIKEQLLSLGYTFSTQTDTEVILAAYHERGVACLEHFNGMWAICIYDPAKQELFCARDRLGQKPFYYTHTSTTFSFSSEIKSLHTHLDVCNPQSINPDAIDFYLQSGYIPSPFSIFTGIKKLPAGHALTVQLPSLEIAVRQWYHPPAYSPIENKQELIDKGKEILTDAVRLRLFTSDVPVGAFLSGGIDSSSVVATCSTMTDKALLNTFSVGFEGDYDESTYMHLVKDTLQTKHHHYYFTHDEFEQLLPEISYYYDEPFADYSHFPTSFISQKAKADVTVVLTGDGGDEIFGGYTLHQIAAQMVTIRKLPTWVRKLLHKLVPAGSDNVSPLAKLKEALRISFFPPSHFFAELLGSSVYKPTIYKQRSIEKMKHYIEEAGGDFVQAAIDYDLYTHTLADNFLVKVDRASMSYGLEARSPFLDVRFIELSRQIPSRWKTTTRQRKILLKSIVQDLLPDAIIHRKKTGFKPPLDQWILQPDYLQQIEEGMKQLHQSQILNDERYHFYTHTVMQQENELFANYKIRMYLLIHWATYRNILPGAHLDEKVT